MMEVDTWERNWTRRLTMQVPPIIQKLLSPFPFHTYLAIPPPRQSNRYPTPCLWIHPPHSPNGVLSSDVECFKWRAYLAPRGLDRIAVRTDIDPQGAIDGQLPNLRDGAQLLAARELPAWVDSKVNTDNDSGLEGYEDEAARDESRAWVALLEGCMHAALLASVLARPLAPLSSLTSLFPTFGTRIPREAIQLRYWEAIRGFSERSGTDKWFLSSEALTLLDALVFAYLHCILHSKALIRLEVTRRVNLVAWEWRVKGLVKAAFLPRRRSGLIAPSL
ncbi:uncharacterized protein EV420DRAFT_1520516 [Desarmillaria tabescens]|uniref:Metaxin glutathione S-transferase domain-containing protein n=1 Tax=Armillaria tabescens TaxID=1929756 RepID=A0AA39NE72_ARMTA|nr:uncharacterized protein EV420DRAFT_1520516 [Desarmillaria tabescens]KAK0463879.1 hypothetical protein EV420DRAFT_1520516 [Desarmillaria tabescens]